MGEEDSGIVLEGNLIIHGCDQIDLLIDWSQTP